MSHTDLIKLICNYFPNKNTNAPCNFVRKTLLLHPEIVENYSKNITHKDYKV